MDSEKWLKEPNFVLGLMIAPAVAPVSFIFFLFALVMIHQVVDIGVRSIGILGLTLGALTFGFPTSYLVAWIPGFPFVLWLQRTGRLKFRNVVAPLIPLTFLIFFVSGLAIHKEPTLKNCCFWSLYLSIITGPSIILSCICFWLISVHRRFRPVVR